MISGVRLISPEAFATMLVNAAGSNAGGFAGSLNRLIVIVA